MRVLEQDQTATFLGATPPPHERVVDPIDLLRSQEYDLLAALLGRAPTEEVRRAVSRIEGDGSPLGIAHAALGRAAAETGADRLSQEFFDLFIGVGRGELLPYASYYLTGFLNERPLARIRQGLASCGLERAPSLAEPEDHVAILLETMAGLAGGRFGAEAEAERRFFEAHLKPWAARFFADLEAAPSARFYRAVGGLGRLFMEIEAEAFSIQG